MWFIRQHVLDSSLDWDGSELDALVDRLASLLREVRREALEEAAKRLTAESESKELGPCDVAYCAEGCFHGVWFEAAETVRALISSEEVRRG